MKQIYLIVTALIAVVFSTSAQEGATPASWEWFDQIPEIASIELPSLDAQRVAQEDAEMEAAGGMLNNGRVVFSSHDMTTEGSWSVLPDGSRICRFRLKSPGALAIGVYFDSFYLPEGSSLYAYDPQLSYWIGPMDSKENNDHMRFVTGQVFGDDIILEYHEPADLVETPVLNIRGAGNFYRHVYDYRNEDEARGSDPCQVDVACPEGENWQEQKDAVVRLQITDGQFIGLCSGVLMNTTAGDFRQYLLSALHCAEGVSAADLNFLQVKFNYERPICGAGFYPQNRNKTGVTLLADSNDGGGASGSDFILFEIEDYIDDSWNPYFAGWRSSTSTSPNGVGIHHPSGDIKKISTYTENLVSVWVGAPGSHWSVEWAETETNHGVTEGGSSGSPIFDNNKYVVGTLTGGGSFCNQPLADDYYGKMSYHFSSNPNPASEKLKLWLDPAGTNANTLNGSYRDGSVSVSEGSLAEFEVFPNPATDGVNIRIPENAEIERLELHNELGQLLISERPASSFTRINLSDLASGFYYLTLRSTDGVVQTKSLVKE